MSPGSPGSRRSRAGRRGRGRRSPSRARPRSAPSGGQAAKRSRRCCSRSMMRTRSAWSRSRPAVSDEESADCSRSAAVIAASADSSVRADGLARLTTSPASGMSSSVSRSTKYAASRSASGSGAATTTNAVPSAWSSAKVFSARCRKLAEERVEGRDEGLHVACSIWPPRILASALVTTEKPAVISRAGPRAGASEQPDQPTVEEAREPLRGVEEVQRGARGRGVDHDQVVAAVGQRLPVQLAQLLHRHVLLRAGERARQRDVERVLQDLLGLLRRWPATRPPRRRCASCRASSRRATRPRPRRRTTPAAGCCRAARCPSTARADGPGRSSARPPCAPARPHGARAPPTSWSCRRRPRRSTR